MVNPINKHAFIALADWVLPIDQPPIAQGFVRVNTAGKIEAIGQQADLAIEALETFPCPDPDRISLLTPGLINTHAHLELSFASSVLSYSPFRGEGVETSNDASRERGVDFADWLLSVVQITRQPQHSTSAAKLSRIQAGITAMVQSGTTCVNDISSDGASLEALHQTGLRGRVSLEFFHPSLKPDSARLNGLMDQIIVLHQQALNDPNVTLGLSPHSPFNVALQAWRWMIEAWHKQFGTAPWVHTHLAESQDEVDWIAGRASGLNRLHQHVLGQTFSPETTGLSPVGYLQHAGLLNPPLVLAHGVFTDTNDRHALNQPGIGLAHCPRSNRILHGQTLDFADWQQDAPQVPLGLGTDSLLSTPNLDLREEARTAMRLHGLAAEDLLQMLTLSGARVMGLDSIVGSLTPGKAADMVLWKAEKSETETPAEWLLAPTTQCATVWCDGKPLIYS